jgi:hypothetical protein
MDNDAKPANKNEIVQQVAEATALLDLIPGLLDDNARLRAQLEEASHELAELRAIVDPLRGELGRSRAERQELTEALGKVMSEMGQIMGEFAPRVRLVPRPSPFARETNGHAEGNGHVHANGPSGTNAVATFAR